MSTPENLSEAMEDVRWEHDCLSTLGSINGERVSQKHKWGTRILPLELWLTILSEEVGELAEAALEARGSISDEKHAEWLKRAQHEAIQVAAVAAAIAQQLRTEKPV